MRFALCLLCLASCLPVIGQEPRRLPVAARVQKHLYQPSAIVTATELKQDGEVFALKGKVQLRTDTFTLEAEDVVYNHETGEVEAHGDVRIKPSPIILSRSDSQFGVK